MNGCDVWVQMCDIVFEMFCRRQENPCLIEGYSLQLTYWEFFPINLLGIHLMSLVNLT